MKFIDDRIVSFANLKEIIDSHAEKINAPQKYYPTFDNIRGDATPNIEIIKDGYYYVISERGNEIDRRYTPFLDMLIFWIFKDITSWMSLDNQSNSLTSHADSRMKLLSNQVELLNKINPEYAETVIKEYELLLGQDWYSKK